MNGIPTDASERLALLHQLKCAVAVRSDQAAECLVECLLTIIDRRVGTVPTRTMPSEPVADPYAEPTHPAELRAEKQRDRAKRAEGNAAELSHRLAELERDRIRALRRAYEYTLDTQSLDEAVASLVECIRMARQQCEESDRRANVACDSEASVVAENESLRTKLRVAQADREDVWFWQGQDDEPSSLSCPVVMSAETLRALLARATMDSPGNGHERK